MSQEGATATSGEAPIQRGRLIAAAAVALALVGACLYGIEEPRRAWAASIAVVCLVLWLSEIVPPFVPTLFLLAISPLLLMQHGDQRPVESVLRWALDPVLALFFGGFALALASSRHGLDAAFTHRLVSWSYGSKRALVAWVMFGTAFMSMWMSNVAASAMMIAAVVPLLHRIGPHDPYRQAMLLAVAIGANLGGMGTPIGSGPNAIAIATLDGQHSITFIGWMVFAVPLMALLLGIGCCAILAWFRVSGSVAMGPTSEPPALTLAARSVVLVAGAAILMWLTEPLHGVPAPVVALALAALLFASRLLHAADVMAIDWSTLILIAGGLALGQLLQYSGLIGSVAAHLSGPLDATILVWAFVGLAALMAAVMSNTATATLLIPVALVAEPGSPTLCILIALGTSLGMPFVISTPPNALAYGRGLRSSTLLGIGGFIMIVGWVLMSLSGRFVLDTLGVR